MQQPGAMPDGCERSSRPAGASQPEHRAPPGARHQRRGARASHTTAPGLDVEEAHSGRSENLASQNRKRGLCQVSDLATWRCRSDMEGLPLVGLAQGNELAGLHSCKAGASARPRNIAESPMCLSAARGVMSRKIEPLGPTRWTADPTFLQRLAKPLIHESFLGLPRLPDLKNRPAVLRAPAVSTSRPSGQLPSPLAHIDPWKIADRLVLSAADTPKFENQSALVPRLGGNPSPACRDPRLAGGGDLDCQCVRCAGGVGDGQRRPPRPGRAISVLDDRAACRRAPVAEVPRPRGDRAAMDGAGG
jgi:hypothetical protein